MKAKYRIIKNNDTYYVQRRKFLLWIAFKETNNNVTLERLFNSIEDTKNYIKLIEQLKLKLSDKKKIVWKGTYKTL